MAIDYPTASAGALAAALRDREVSAVELLDAAIARIEAKDDEINAVAVRDFGRAREAAEAADAALARGERRPLLGVPMTVKESFHVPGLPTTWGLDPFKDWIPPFEATGVTRLKAAGAVIIGKTNVPPNLADFQSDNPVYGRTNNPHDLSRSPGGSSGGAAAALAAGYVPLEFGSDIGGSIRIPAHFCGVYGHKPTFNLIPMTGHAPPGIDAPGAGVELAVVGPLARSAADLDLALGLLAGPDGEAAKAYRVALPPPRATKVGDFRILVLDRHPLAEVDDEVKAVLHATAERLAKAGAKVAWGSERLPDLAAAHGLNLQMLNAIITRGLRGAQPPIDAHAWMAALDGQVAVKRAWAHLFEAFDVVLAPPLGVAAFPHDPSPNFPARTLTINGRETPYFGQLAWSAVATLPGLPATVAPAGWTADGLPVGVQIIGPYLEDRTTIALAGLIGRMNG